MEPADGRSRIARSSGRAAAAAAPSGVDVGLALEPTRLGPRLLDQDPDHYGLLVVAAEDVVVVIFVVVADHSIVVVAAAYNAPHHG
jgi:hypothetical protein